MSYIRRFLASDLPHAVGELKLAVDEIMQASDGSPEYIERCRATRKMFHALQVQTRIASSLAAHATEISGHSGSPQDAVYKVQAQRGRSHPLTALEQLNENEDGLPFRMN